MDHNLLANDNGAFIVFIKLLLKVDKDTGQYITGRFKLSELTNLKPTTAWDILKRLEFAKMVTLRSDNKKTVIHICNWKKFQYYGDRSGDNKVTTNRQQTVTKQEERIKNKEVLLRNRSKPEINELFEYWLNKTGLSITSRIKQNRYAASNLLKKYGQLKLHQLIDGVAKAQDDQYAPRIADFTQLQNKTNELILWGRQKIKKRGVKI